MNCGFCIFFPANKRIFSEFAFFALVSSLFTFQLPFTAVVDISDTTNSNSFGGFCLALVSFPINEPYYNIIKQ